MSTEPINMRRTIRKYTDEKITEDQLRNLLLAAMYAPSAWGKRSWEFIVVDDDNLKKELGKLTSYSAQAEQAAADIIILADKNASTWIEDSSIAAEHINLEAVKLGLGSSWVQIRGMVHDTMDAEAYLRGLLGIPDHFGICCMITVGYPDEKKSPHRESELSSEKIHYNRYGGREQAA